MTDEQTQFLIELVEDIAKSLRKIDANIAVLCDHALNSK